jgi:hypothetical protein
MPGGKAEPPPAQRHRPQEKLVISELQEGYMNGKDVVRYLRWIAVNDQAVMCPQLAKEAADFIEAALGIISTYDDLRNQIERKGGVLLGRESADGKEVSEEATKI